MVFTLRTLSNAAIVTVVLGACAAPTADERAKYMDQHYGTTCAALVPESTSPKYRECVANAYETDMQRAISKYNADHGKTGAGALLLIR